MSDAMSEQYSTRERLYRTMRLIRRFEEYCIKLVRSGEIAGGIHPYIGQEAIAAGVCAALRPDDYITSTHRGHGHVLAKGADPAGMMAELTGRITGLNKGRGGSMHAADVGLGILGANGIVGAGAPIAAGAAWAATRAGEDRIAVSFFGDGAVSQGVVLESFNLAALWRLPVLFVCENNGYASTLTVDNAVAGTIVGRAAAFGIPAARIDGTDAEAVMTATREYADRARSGGGPALLECTAYRFDAHHTWEHKSFVRYRSREEVAEGRSRDPLLVQAELISTEARDRIDQEVEDVLESAREFALASPKPDPADALDHLYATGLRPRAGVSAHA
ncbi:MULTISPECIES: thiamine pyrophosphate-dependent dehydrogenase E1 component subunit alpha [Streptomyces]|uniref:thiamine pyrophosphate-dependent dehydrogenase E1 component subunit alpha n=1 Tax=Streptomyces TaxID=1883 RepID=UPI000B0A5568|nr:MULTISPECIES: thiamine pyrophosphate-dependent dehydrogenase E1 component subunit alpha [Streptomyces]